MAVREIVNDRILGGSYHDVSNFRNVIFSSILALFEYYENFFFPGEPDRIVYSTTDFAFRRRLQTQKLKSTENDLSINSLNFPFMSFSIQPGGINQAVERSSWKNFPLEREGIMDWTIGKKLRLSPLNIDFEATYFTNKTTDMHWAMSEVLWDNTLETIIKPKILIDDVEFENIGNLSLNSSYNSNYAEKDWLEKNKIQAITLDFSCDTFLIKDQNSSFGIPQTVLFDFIHKQNIENVDFDNPDEVYSAVIDHIHGEVNW